MSRTPFDTQRLDKECERIEREMATDPDCDWSPRAQTIKSAILGEKTREFICEEHARAIFDRCRRPKAIPEVSNA